MEVETSTALQMVSKVANLQLHEDFVVHPGMQQRGFCLPFFFSSRTCHLCLALSLSLHRAHQFSFSLHSTVTLAAIFSAILYSCSCKHLTAPPFRHESASYLTSYIGGTWVVESQLLHNGTHNFLTGILTLLSR